MEPTLNSRLATIGLTDSDGRAIAPRFALHPANRSYRIPAPFRLNPPPRTCPAVARQRRRIFGSAALAAVGLGDFAYAKAFPGEIGITFPLLVDEKRDAHRAMEVKSANLFLFCAKIISKRALEPRPRGHSHYSLGKNPFQLGRNLVFGPVDVDRFAAFQRNVWKRRFDPVPSRKH
jgi:hypothetical protein